MKTNKINSKEACTLAHKIRRETGCSLAEAFKQAYSGTPTAAPTYYTQQDLDKIFSDKTAELIKKGYMIHVPTMSGSQGEMAYITFIKNNPSVLRRPIIVDDKRVQVGYNEEEIRTFIPRARRYADLLCGEWCPKFPTCPVGTDRRLIDPADEQCLAEEEKYFKKD